MSHQPIDCCLTGLFIFTVLSMKQLLFGHRILPGTRDIVLRSVALVTTLMRTDWTPRYHVAFFGQKAEHLSPKRPGTHTLQPRLKSCAAEALWRGVHVNHGDQGLDSICWISGHHLVNVNTAPTCKLVLGLVWSSKPALHANSVPDSMGRSFSFYL